MPVLRQRALDCPDCLFLVAAPPLIEPLFNGIENVRFVGTNKASSWQLYQKLNDLQPDMVADMHWVNRTIGMDFFFALKGIKVRHIRKRDHKEKPSWKRYDEVFDRLGLISSNRLVGLSERYLNVKSPQAGPVLIGVAPFAQHKGKIWPEEGMKELLSLLGKKPEYQVLLFGSKAEAPTLESWAEPYPNIQSIAGKLSFQEELDKISSLQLMVSMDSSNMHFASCLEVPVVSVWGATHPKSGFYGWRQRREWAVQKDFECRPCSKYGKKPCKFGDYRCLYSITAEDVLTRIEAVLSNEN